MESVIAMFILLSLTLCYLIQNASPLLRVLINPSVGYVSIGLAMCCLISSIRFKHWLRCWVDGFASCVLVGWFVYWQPIFKDDSPVFFYFSLYFAIMAALLDLLFGNSPKNLDEQSRRLLQSFARHPFAQVWFLMLAVLGSLLMLEHYLLLPVMLTLLWLRLALNRFIV